MNLRVFTEYILATDAQQRHYMIMKQDSRCLRLAFAEDQRKPFDQIPVF